MRLSICPMSHLRTDKRKASLNRIFRTIAIDLLLHSLCNNKKKPRKTTFYFRSIYTRALLPSIPILEAALYCSALLRLFAYNV